MYVNRMKARNWNKKDAEIEIERKSNDKEIGRMREQEGRKVEINKHERPVKQEER